jgi:hypothetical protein
VQKGIYKRTMIDHLSFQAEWVAVKTDDPAAILHPIGLTDFSSTIWEEGIKTSVRQRWNKLFISPVINGWVLLFGDLNAILERYHAFFQIEEEYNWRAVLAQMSDRFSEVQLYVTYDGNYQYLRAIQGNIERVFGSSPDDVFEIGLPTSEEIRLSGTVIPELYEQSELYIGSELPFVMAGIWSVNPLEFDEPHWEWLRNAHGLLYNGESKYQKEQREYLENWRKNLGKAYLEEKYGIDIKDIDATN